MKEWELRVSQKRDPSAASGAADNRRPETVRTRGKTFGNLSSANEVVGMQDERARG